MKALDAMLKNCRIYSFKRRSLPVARPKSTGLCVMMAGTRGILIEKCGFRSIIARKRRKRWVGDVLPEIGQPRADGRRRLAALAEIILR
jgi:hypothetical protein